FVRLGGRAALWWRAENGGGDKSQGGAERAGAAKAKARRKISVRNHSRGSVAPPAVVPFSAND
ncbi:MAG: hypothetical protein ABI897_10590, partial [Spartobacteria bacterium]